MTRTAILTILSAVAVPASVYATEADTAAVMSPGVMRRIAGHDDMMRTMALTPCENPAIRQWLQDYSYSSIAADVRYGDESRAVDVQRGTGATTWGFEADSYMKYRSSTLWGSAGYRNGRQRGVRWNESSDAGMIYPYFTADSIGGDLHVETYSFAGGYADHNDRWAWGVTLGYNAGLYYRNIDPRPRNTTGRLDIAAGGAVRIGRSDYRGGVSVSYRKYKQSCDIEFVNELSDNSIWHLTGLGTHYERFAGSGYSHYYNGHRWGVSADLYPSSRKGAVASVTYTSFKFDHVLTSFNKLPLQSAADNRLTVMAGWLAPGTVHDFAGTVSATVGKRTGTENLFGDASGNVYPQIGALDLYSHALTVVGADMLWQWHHGGGALLSVKPAVAWSRSEEKYIEPRRRLLLSSVSPGATVQYSCRPANAWHAVVALRFVCNLPVDDACELPYDSSMPPGLQEVDINRYEILSKSNTGAGINVNVSRALTDRYALGLSLSYTRHNYADGVHADYASAAVSFIF